MWTAEGPERFAWRALAPILAAHDQPVAREADPDDPTGPLHHLLRVFLIDGTATIRNIFSRDVLAPACCWRTCGRWRWTRDSDDERNPLIRRGHCSFASPRQYWHAFR